MTTKYDNSGTLFKNDRKEKDTHADYQGSATINGVEFWISSWIKEGQKGKFMSLAFKPKQERAAEIVQQARGSAPANFSDLTDDEVPFLMEWR